MHMTEMDMNLQYSLNAGEPLLPFTTTTPLGKGS